MRRLCAVLAVWFLTGCEGDSPRISSSPPAGTPGTLSPSPEVDRLQPIVLIANLAERPARWSKVATIPFGPAEDQLGFAEPLGEGLNVLPRSFAVAGDGSLWVLDVFKERLAHFSPDGRYLDSAGHLEFSSPWDARDVIWRDGELLVLLASSQTVAAAITVVDAHRQEDRTPILYEGDPAVIYSIVPGTTSIVGELHGLAMSPGVALGSGPTGWAELEVPGSGGADPLPGVPLPGGEVLDVAPVRGHSDLVEVTIPGPATTTIQPIEIRLVARAGGKVLEPAMAVFVQGALEHGLASLVQIQPAGGALADRLGDGRWFLQVSADGSPLVWERLPDHLIRDELQVRQLTVGPDGGVYLMVADPDGVTIYRR